MRKTAIIIPARGGSKSVPGKNLYKLNGKPLIDYTIEFAKLIGLDVFVTSDSEDILSRAKFHKIGKIIRPKELATDTSKINDTLLHAAQVLNNEQIIYDSFLILQPTFLLRDLEEVKQALEIFNSQNIESLVALVKMREHPSECIELELSTKKWNYLKAGPKGATNRQDFKNNFYFISGCFYLATINCLEKYKGYMHENTEFFISKDRYIVDIDEPQDIDFAKSQIYRLKEYNI